MRCLIAQINTGGSLSPCLGLASYSLLLRSVPIKWNTMLQIKYKKASECRLYILAHYAGESLHMS